MKKISWLRHLYFALSLIRFIHPISNRFTNNLRFISDGLPSWVEQKRIYTFWFTWKAYHFHHCLEVNYIVSWYYLAQEIKNDKNEIGILLFQVDISLFFTYAIKVIWYNTGNIEYKANIQFDDSSLYKLDICFLALNMWKNNKTFNFSTYEN